MVTCSFGSIVFFRRLITSYSFIVATCGPRFTVRTSPSHQARARRRSEHVNVEDDPVNFTLVERILEFRPPIQ